VFSFIFGMTVLSEIFYVPVVSEFITGGISTFLMHLLSLGWSDKFREIVIE